MALVIAAAVLVAAGVLRSPVAAGAAGQAQGRDPAFSQPSMAAGVDYTVPTRATIRATLDRIRDHFVRATPYRIIDVTTGAPIVDLSKPIKNAGIDARYGEHNDWTYPMGVVLAAMIHVTDVTGDRSYLDYTLKNFDFIFDHLEYFRAQAAAFGPQRLGYGRMFDMRELDHCGAIGAALIKAYAKRPDPRYRPMIDVVADFISNKMFRLPDGTLGRPRPQPVSLWIDDAYMSIPFLAQMGKLTGERRYYDDAAKQVIQMAAHLLDPATNLYDHAWFANATYDPKFYWGRGAGWALMATAELLSVLPEDHRDRAKVLDVFQRSVQGVTAVQGATGLWHQLLDRTDSYLETSASAMFTFAIARGVNRGWLAPVYAPVAQTGWQALTQRVRLDGQIDGICVGTTAAYDAVYYYNRPTDLGAMQGYGPVIMAGAEVMTMIDSFDIERVNNTFHYRVRK
ncbi:MAG: glycoside hydrolase family 88 protein [Acidobacteria bacterium]|nr:glycoside hydrolase family 88 protein [Acidobacteriota bacterium]